MITANKTSRILGAAFLLQFVTSLTSGLLQKQVLIVPGNIGETMLNFASNPWLVRTTILLDLFTAMGVIFLGVALFLTLRKQNEIMALTAVALYILEGALLAASRADTLSLLRISQEYSVAATPALQMMGQVAFESMDFAGSTLHMLVFCFGGILFYSLLYKSGVVPRALSLWGLVTVLPCLVGTLLAVFGVEAPFAIYLPYAPFELVIGVWILIKGIPEVNFRQRVSLETT